MAKDGGRVNVLGETAKGALKGAAIGFAAVLLGGIAVTALGVMLGAASISAFGTGTLGTALAGVFAGSGVAVSTVGALATTAAAVSIGASVGGGLSAVNSIENNRNVGAEERSAQAQIAAAHPQTIVQQHPVIATVPHQQPALSASPAKDSPTIQKILQQRPANGQHQSFAETLEASRAHPSNFKGV